MYDLQYFCLLGCLFFHLTEHKYAGQTAQFENFKNGAITMLNYVSKGNQNLSGKLFFKQICDVHVIRIHSNYSLQLCK